MVLKLKFYGWCVCFLQNSPTDTISLPIIELAFDILVPVVKATIVC